MPSGPARNAYAQPHVPQASVLGVYEGFRVPCGGIPGSYVVLRLPGDARVLTIGELRVHGTIPPRQAVTRSACADSPACSASMYAPRGRCALSCYSHTLARVRMAMRSAGVSVALPRDPCHEHRYEPPHTYTRGEWTIAQPIRRRYAFPT